MPLKKLVKVSDDNWKSLWKLKFKWELRSINEVITKLLEGSE